MKNHWILKIMMTVLIVFVVADLTGCASFTQYQSIKVRCATSRLLITDLSQPVSARKVMLPEGHLCSREAV